MDTQIDRGVSLSRIGRAARRTREHARQYILYSGQREVWLANKQKRRERERAKERQKKNLLTRLGNVIFSLAHQRVTTQADQISLRYGRQYWYRRPAHLQSLFETYTQRNGRISLNALVRASDIDAMTICRILSRAGLAQPHEDRGHSTISPATKRVLRRAHSTFLCARDVAYFAGVSDHVATAALRGRACRPFLGPSRTTYRTASMVYEALDAQFSLEDAAYLANIPVSRAHKISSLRDTLEPPLIAALQKLFPERNITRPYLTQTAPPADKTTDIRK